MCLGVSENTEKEEDPWPWNVWTVRPISTLHSIRTVLATHGELLLPIIQSIVSDDRATVFHWVLLEFQSKTDGANIAMGNLASLRSATGTAMQQVWMCNPHKVDVLLVFCTIYERL